MATLNNRYKSTKRKPLKHKGLYDYRWRVYSRQYRKNNPMCNKCGINIHPDDGQRLGAVDHIKPVSEGKTAEERFDLFWNPDNHQGLCWKCHDSKSSKQYN